MSRKHPNPERPYWLEAYYGPGGRKGTRERPNQGRIGEREHDLCIAVEYGVEWMRDMEKEMLEAREDIDVIVVGRNP